MRLGRREEWIEDDQGLTEEDKGPKDAPQEWTAPGCEEWTKVVDYEVGRYERSLDSKSFRHRCRHNGRYRVPKSDSRKTPRR